MHTFRTRFKKEIVAEYLPPSRKSDKVIIFCSGMPSGSSKSELLNFYAKKGYWVFLPRYRGTWESDGEFLKHSPHKDISDVIDELFTGFIDLFSGKKITLKPKRIILIGASFGGPAAILNSADPRVTKVLAFSPVVDWRVEGSDEPLDWLEKFIIQAFGQGYRFKHSGWIKLMKGKFYSPEYSKDDVDGEKITIFHAKDDRIVPIKPSLKFARSVGCRLVVYKKGGHSIGKNAVKASFYKKIKKFL